MTDDQGKRYDISAVSTNLSPRDVYIEELPLGLRSDQWIEFPAPDPNITTLTLHLERESAGLVGHPRFTITIPAP